MPVAQQSAGNGDAAGAGSDDENPERPKPAVMPFRPHASIYDGNGIAEQGAFARQGELPGTGFRVHQ